MELRLQAADVIQGAVGAQKFLLRSREVQFAPGTRHEPPQKLLHVPECVRLALTLGRGTLLLLPTRGAGSWALGVTSLGLRAEESSAGTHGGSFNGSLSSVLGGHAWHPDSHSPFCANHCPSTNVSAGSQMLHQHPVPHSLFLFPLLLFGARGLRCGWAASLPSGSSSFLAGCVWRRGWRGWRELSVLSSVRRGLRRRRRSWGGSGRGAVRGCGVGKVCCRAWRAWCLARNGGHSMGQCHLPHTNTWG